VDALAVLGVRDGDVIFDVGCGTGAMLPELARRAGRSGRVLGLELSPAMAAQAARRVADFANVEVVCGPVESMQPGAVADALMFFYTHDLLQNPDALARVFASARRGARVVVAGLGLLGPWATPINAVTAWRARHYLTTFRGLRRPWQPLLQYCPDLRVLQRYFPGTNYLAMGRFAAAMRTVP
jgi:SAM-dependent methyltransferase